jgi:plasmid stabilization system protein ParE
MLNISVDHLSIFYSCLAEWKASQANTVVKLLLAAVPEQPGDGSRGSSNRDANSGHFNFRSIFSYAKHRTAFRQRNKGVLKQRFRGS